MHRNKPHPWNLAIKITIMLVAGGCDRRDERLTQLAQTNIALQAQQNQYMAELSREVASGTRRLVEVSAAGTDKLLAMQGDLQRQHQQLEEERRTMAEQRTRESFLAPVINSLGATLLALLPLLICWRLLAQMRDEPPETELSGLLLEQLVNPEHSQRALPIEVSVPAGLSNPSSSSSPNDVSA